MRIQRFSRVLFLTLIVVAAFMAGWPESRRGGAAGSKRDAESRQQQPAQATPAATQQAAADQPSPAPASGGAPVSSSAMSIPVLPFIIEYGYAKKYFVER